MSREWEGRTKRRLAVPSSNVPISQLQNYNSAYDLSLALQPLTLALSHAHEQALSVFLDDRIERIPWSSGVICADPRTCPYLRFGEQEAPVTLADAVVPAGINDHVVLAVQPGLPMALRLHRHQNQLIRDGQSVRGATERKARCQCFGSLTSVVFKQRWIDTAER